MPLHLISHEHYDSFSVLEKCTGEDEEGQHKDDDHSPHSANDHLSGFWSVVTPPLALAEHGDHGTETKLIKYPPAFGRTYLPRDRGPPEA